MPNSARDQSWYLAGIVEEIRVSGDERNVVNLNFVLVRADSAGGAFERALEIGKAAEAFYANPDGKSVHAIFRGLGYLDLIHDDLEDGAEVMYESRVSVAEDEIQKMLVAREDLAIFSGPRPAPGAPDYRSADIVEILRSAKLDR